MSDSMAVLAQFGFGGDEDLTVSLIERLDNELGDI